MPAPKTFDEAEAVHFFQKLALMVCIPYLIDIQSDSPQWLLILGTE
jgi:hypothetical protein